MVAVVCGFRAYTRKSGRRIPQASPSTPERSFVGSLRWTRKRGFGGGSVTRPLGMLTVFAWGVRLSPSTVLVKPFVPTVELRYGEISSASVGTSRTLPANCVEIRAPQPDYFAVLWTPEWSAVLETLQAHGVPVDRTPTPFRASSWPDR